MTGTVRIKHERSYTVATHELAVTHQLSQTHVRPLKTCAGLANKHLCLVRASSWVVVEVHLVPIICTAWNKGAVVGADIGNKVTHSMSRNCCGKFVPHVLHCKILS